MSETCPDKEICFVNFLKLYYRILYTVAHISKLIFKKVATEIEHILRLSKLKEYASH